MHLSSVIGAALVRNTVNDTISCGHFVIVLFTEVLIEQVQFASLTKALERA